MPEVSPQSNHLKLISSSKRKACSNLAEWLLRKQGHGLQKTRLISTWLLTFMGYKEIFLSHHFQIMKEMISRWPHLGYITWYMTSPDLGVNIVMCHLKWYKIWPRLKLLCLGACLWVDLWSQDSQPEWSAITQPATVRASVKSHWRNAAAGRGSGKFSISRWAVLVLISPCKANKI